VETDEGEEDEGMEVEIIEIEEPAEPVPMQDSCLQVIFFFCSKVFIFLLGN
jgi:hypothetical protein